MEKTKFIRVIGFINGEDIKQDISISSIDKNEKTLDVDLKTDIENEIVEADTPDEFVMMEICRAYPKTPLLLYVIQAQTKCNIAI